MAGVVLVSAMIFNVSINLEVSQRCNATLIVLSLRGCAVHALCFHTSPRPELSVCSGDTLPRRGTSHRNVGANMLRKMTLLSEHTSAQGVLRVLHKHTSAHTALLLPCITHS
jgi:hypothetical protein